MWELFLIVVGVLIGVMPGVVRHGFVQVGHARALSELAEEIRQDAETYLKDGISSPLYRTATDYYRSSFEALMRSGGLRSDEMSALLRFGSQAEQFNRGLDQAYQWLITDPGGGSLEREVARLHDKAKELGQGGDIETRYDAAARQLVSLTEVSFLGWLVRQVSLRA